MEVPYPIQGDMVHLQMWGEVLRCVGSDYDDYINLMSKNYNKYNSRILIA